MPRVLKKSHPWHFRSQFRRNAFGWRGSRLAIQRIAEAVAEIKAIARTDPTTAADGAVLFLEQVSPALEQIDSSSGAIGTAVNRAIADLVPIVADAPAERRTRAKWLQRLWTALEDDAIPYIETLADHWGQLCSSKDVASEWGDRLVGITRMALSPDPTLRGYFKGTSACLSALFRADRYAEIIDILRTDNLWHYTQWAVKARAALGQKAEAIRYAESCRGPWTPDGSVDRVCEEILLSSGFADEAYARYGRCANRRGTYLATFRAVAKKYPQKQPGEILLDLVADSPGDEGKWFAAAKEAQLYELALDLARRSPCDPRTLARAARDYVERQPSFAVEAGLLSLHWILEGHGYEVTGREILDAFSHTMRAAENNGTSAMTRERIRQLVAHDAPDGVVHRILARALEI